MLPVIAKITVDLSRVDMGLVTHISSFIETSSELLNLALTCKSFGWRQPTSVDTMALDWSLIEEVARKAVCSKATDAEMTGCLPHYVSGTTTWLSILNRFEHLLEFDVLLGGGIEHQNGDKTKVRCADDDVICTALSSSPVMRSGSHYAEFQLITEVLLGVGIVRPMPGLVASVYEDGEFAFFGIQRLYSDFLAQRSDDWGDGNVHVCELYCFEGMMNWTNWEGEGHDEDWEGNEPYGPGDTVGMLLNLDEGTLTVYRNNRRLGVLKDGLAGSYCWYVTIASLDGLIDGDDDSSDGVGMESVVIRRATAPALNNV